MNSKRHQRELRRNRRPTISATGPPASACGKAIFGAIEVGAAEAGAIHIGAIGAGRPAIFWVGGRRRYSAIQKIFFVLVTLDSGDGSCWQRRLHFGEPPGRGRVHPCYMPHSQQLPSGRQPILVVNLTRGDGYLVLSVGGLQFRNLTLELTQG
jgi:hypothetical protein